MNWDIQSKISDWIYNNNINNISVHIVPSASDIFETLYIQCSICLSTKQFSVPYWTNDSYGADWLINNAANFAKLHEHKVQFHENGISTELLIYLQKISKYIDSVPIKDPCNYVAIRCEKCNSFVVANSNRTPEEKLEIFEPFANLHKHEVVYYEKSFINNLKSQTKMSIPANNGNTIKFYNYTPLTSDSVSSIEVKLSIGVNLENIDTSIIKEIYRLSDFNVDLQARKAGNIVTDHKLLCGNCNGFLLIDYQELIATRTNKTWESIREFCRTHRHMDLASNVTGRKFKEA